MAEKTPASEIQNHPVTDAEEQNGSQAGLPGSSLYRLEGSIIWYLLAVIAYALSSIGLAIYMSRCPVEAPAIRVLPTGNLKVDPFYASLALSCLVTPAAICIRSFSNDLALLHPFTVASKKQVRVSDLDKLMDPGLCSLICLFKYTTTSALVQTFLMIVGATFVPIGTLLVYTGTYAPASFSDIAVVGIPNLNGFSLSVELGVGDEVTTVKTPDAFLPANTEVFTGLIIRQAGIVTPTSPRLGPQPTTNLTYVEGAWYEGIVTYSWKSGCDYTEDITFAIDKSGNYGDGTFNITFPNGHQLVNQDPLISGPYMTNITSSSNITTTYYAVIGDTSQFANVTQAQAAGAIQVIDSSFLISRVACTPTFNWELSTCQWKNNSMTSCSPAPNTNTTVIDNAGLDALSFYMSAIPMSANSDATNVLGYPTLYLALIVDSAANNGGSVLAIAPQLSNYDNMYGLVAQSLAILTTSGYYGVSKVPASIPKPVYLVRMYILALVVAILVLAPLLTILILLSNLRHQIPLRRATFLTVAVAVRGPGWDKTFFGLCVMGHGKLVKKFKSLRVMFGVDVDTSSHVGFAKKVDPIKKEDLYTGVEGMERKEK
jgi:hypothetical protein